MTLSATITRVDDPGEIAARFEPNREIHVYGLGDLDEPLWGRSQWWVAGPAAVGVVDLVGDRSAVAVYAISDTAPDLTVEMLHYLRSEIPAGALATGPLGMGPAVAKYRPMKSLGPHTKLALRNVDRLSTAPAVPVAALGHLDVDDILDLHASDPGAAFFVPAMLETGLFTGVRGNGQLVAIAGTHTISEHHKVGAIGGVMTHPEHRGNGYAAATTAALSRRLNDLGYTVGLNVDDGNATAIALYQRLGFEIVHHYEEIEFGPVAPTRPDSSP